ncbi:organic solute transporter Ostalpha-domain-containing protein [Geranomyces variabilis]|nr:organic solute transporter Ostalpha-domain-containing protein [Geranomyces variabilis]KAJ3142410.1 hypothetical protein HDU90_004684 [Geranomyces variabilis]
MAASLINLLLARRDDDPIILDNSTVAANDTITGTEEVDECADLTGPNFDPTSPEFQKVVLAFNITIVLAVLSMSASFYLCIQHFRHYFKPQFQRWIVRILLMIPVYSFCSCLEFRFYWYTPYIDVVRDSYEAFALYSFHRLLLLYLGPDLDAQHARMAGKSEKRYPAPFCCWWYNPAGYAFLLNTRWLVLQYVVVRPFTTIMALAMWGLGVLCPNSSSPAHGQFWVTYMNLISSTLAVYGLFTLYVTISADIREYKPLWKIIAVKFVVFVSFWGGLVISGLVSLDVIKSNAYYDADAASDMINAFMICTEMLIAAILHIKAFPHTDFTDPAQPQLRTRMLPAMLDALSPVHIWQDIAAAPTEMRAHRKRRKERRAKRELKGVVGDAFDSDAISMVNIDIGSPRRSSVKSQRWGGSAAGTPLKSIPALPEDIEGVSEDESEEDEGSEYSSSDEAGMGLANAGARFASSDPLKPDDLNL